MKDFDHATSKYNRHNAYWLAWCSQLAYQKREIINNALMDVNMGLVSFHDTQESQAFVAADDKKMIVAIRGTDSLRDVMSDINIDLVYGPGGKVHEGANIALGSIWKEIYSTIKDYRGERSLWITGHSLGAGMACIACAKLYFEKQEKVDGFYNFGMLRIGNKDFAENFQLALGHRTFRFVNNNDIVTRTPFRSMGYHHVGTFKYFDEHGRQRDDINWAQKLIDRVKGRLLDLFEPGTDGIKDHAIANYVRNLRDGG